MGFLSDDHEALYTPVRSEDAAPRCHHCDGLLMRTHAAQRDTEDGRPLSPWEGAAEGVADDVEAHEPPEDAHRRRPDSASVPQTEEESAMAMQRSQRTAAGGARTVDTWYATTTDGDTAVLALPDAPPIWLIHRPHAQVYWQTEGRRGLTLSLAAARQRLAMVQACGWRSCKWGARTPGAGYASHGSL